MESQQLNEFLYLFTGTAGVIVFIVIVIWMILTFFLPFMVYSIMKSNKYLLEVNKKILAELEGRDTVANTKRVEPEL